MRKRSSQQTDEFQKEIGRGRNEKKKDFLTIDQGRHIILRKSEKRKETLRLRLSEEKAKAVSHFEARFRERKALRESDKSLNLIGRASVRLGRKEEITL